jgi:hypothetical protein
MYLRDGDYGVHVLGEGILKEVCICSAKDASVPGVGLYVDNVMMMGVIDGDSRTTVCYQYLARDGRNEKRGGAIVGSKELSKNN